MKKKENKSTLILRILAIVVAVFLALAIVCTITVNWLELESRKTDTAPALFGWAFVSLNETFAEEEIYDGDLLLVKQVEAYEEGMMVLCRDIATDSYAADNRFSLARITFIREDEYGLHILTNGERIGMIAEGDVLLGEAQYSLRWLGAVSAFMRTPIGFFSLILGPAVLLLLLVLIRSILVFRRHRRALAEGDVNAEEVPAEQEAEETDGTVAVSAEEESLLNQGITLSEETEPLEGKEPELAPFIEMTVEDEPLILERPAVSGEETAEPSLNEKE